MTRGGIKSGEKLVLGQHPGVSKCIEQRGFTAISVAHDGDNGDSAGCALLAVDLALLTHLLDLLAQFSDAPANAPAVNFPLRFTRATPTHWASPPAPPRSH